MPPTFVLTADRILMADYPTLLDGMMAASLTTTTPAVMMRRFLAPPVRCEGLRAVKAPLGLRLVEAALRREGFGAEDVLVTTPEKLREAIGPETRAVFVSSGDPLGIGMNDSTMSGLGGGRPYAPIWYAKMMRELRALKEKIPFKIVAGGPGAWQLEWHADERKRLGIDVLFQGYSDDGIGVLAKKIVSGERVPEVVQAPAAVKAGARILGPASLGAVEVSRGCGLGCPFCTVAHEPMNHVPVETVVANVRTNVLGGERSACLLSEDFLRYGSAGNRLDPDAVLALAEAVRGVENLRIIQIDHVNVSSAARFPLEKLRRLREIMTRGVNHECVWVNLGVESASGRLLAESRCRGKLASFEAAEWESACNQSIENLTTAGFVPMLSLLFGISGETAEDLDRTLALVERFSHKLLVAYPMFLEPVTPDGKAFTVKDMTARHWKIMRACYDLNFKWMPKLYWDNHTGAGVPVWKKRCIQFGGKLKAAEWRLRFAMKAAGAKR